MRSWRLHHRTGLDLVDLAARINPIVRGWMQYSGTFYRSALHTLLARINSYLVRWLQRKYKRLHGQRKAWQCWWRIHTRSPRLFAHWTWVTSAPGLN